MATEDPTKPDPEKTDPPETDPPEDPPEDTDPPEDKPKDEVDPEVAKAIKRRDSAIAARNKLQAELDAMRDKYEKDKSDPVAVANARLVKAEAKTVLTASGVAKEDQAALMRYLPLADVSVSNDGDVDVDAIQDAVDDLKRIFGKSVKDAKDVKRTPRIDTRDKGGNGSKAPDPASARRRAMLGY